MNLNFVKVESFSVKHFTVNHPEAIATPNDSKHARMDLALAKDHREATTLDDLDLAPRHRDGW
jgi:hypothetical protein